MEQVVAANPLVHPPNAALVLNQRGVQMPHLDILLQLARMIQCTCLKVRPLSQQQTCAFQGLWLGGRIRELTVASSW